MVMWFHKLIKTMRGDINFMKENYEVETEDVITTSIPGDIVAND